MKDEAAGEVILQPSSFILLPRLRRGGEWIVAVRRTPVAQMIVPEILFGSHLTEAANTAVLAGPLIQVAR